MGIRRETLYRWKDAHSLINNALKKGREVADYEVQNALFKKAIGYREKVKKHVKLRKEHVTVEGEKFVSEVLQEVEEEVYIPPDTTAQIYWMKVRKKWSDNVVEDNTDALAKLDDVLSKIGGADNANRS